MTTPTARAITETLVLGTVALWLAWTAYVLRYHGAEATISHYLRESFRRWPWLLPVLGALLLHWIGERWD